MKKYYTDSYTRKFTTTVKEEKTLDDGRHGVILEESYFYPTSGGQPNDRGFINDIKVLDVIDGDEVIHIVERPIGAEKVECEIHWQRRFDHMQQHAGQHILSAVFAELYNGETVGFHLSDDYSTVDITLEELTDEMINRVEEVANQIIYRNLPIKTYFVSPKKAGELPLRKVPSVDEDIRIVEVEGEDYSPCGGTHPASTGEIGMIKIRKWESKRGNVRVDFVCGSRALKDYQLKNDQINQISNLLSIREEESLEGVERLYEEGKEYRKEVSYLKGELSQYQAEELYNGAKEINGLKLVTHIFEGLGMGEIKNMSNDIIEHDNVIAILGSTQPGKAQVSFSRSKELDYDMNGLLREVIGLIDGNGGGNPQSAQGGGSNPEKLEEMMNKSEEIIREKVL